MLAPLSVIDWGGETRQTWKKECVFGCNLAFRKAAILEVGGFSTELGRHGTLLISNDDNELVERIEAKGYLVFYCPKAIVHHTIDQQRLERTWFRRRFAWQAVSDFIQHESQSVARGNVAARRVRSAFERLLSGKDNAPFAIKREAKLAYNLVAAGLSGAEILRDMTTVRKAQRSRAGKRAGAGRSENGGEEPCLTTGPGLL